MMARFTSATFTTGSGLNKNRKLGVNMTLRDDFAFGKGVEK
jgi:hypothetical protein